ncbi:Protein H05L03.3 [Aphelenchoides avenae]|nr:Protein H05L03.3 [Aphelenchus avenae]
MKYWFFLVALLVVIAQILAYPSSNMDLEDQQLGRFYRALMKTKRSPSIGLSLAEYMASPQGQDNFHFIPGAGRK